ncbi:MAG: class I tRNA ligase family protein, partial [Duncaniella sp.]|nr:class I tRNA ligase family protein [Duncaniella sp.]
LYTCLRTVSMLMAPFAPFFADDLYRALTGAENSVHLADYPEVDSSLLSPELEKRQKMAQDITSMALALRRKVNLKVRQPLKTVMIPVTDEAMRADINAIADLVKSEINVKEITLAGADGGIIVKSAKPDFKKLGPKHGKNMKAVAEAVKALDSKQVNALETEGSITIDVNGTPVTVDACDIDIISEDIPGWLVANEGALTIALDVTVTPELRREGLAREIVNRIQNIRKSRGYDITDRISLTFEPSGDNDEAIREHAEYISRQVLADNLDIAAIETTDPAVEQLSIDDVNLNVRIVLNK